MNDLSFDQAKKLEAENKIQIKWYLDETHIKKIILPERKRYEQNVDDKRLDDGT